MKNMNYLRQGCGTPVLLVHGLGGSSRSWSPLLNPLICDRDVIAVDLPGSGATPFNGEVSISSLADALTEFLVRNHLLGVDAVGSSLGARLVLELARRGGVIGSAVALSPCGFWQGVDRHAFYVSMFASIRMLRMLKPILPEMMETATGRSALLKQFSTHPERIPSRFALQELQSLTASNIVDDLLFQLAYGEEQRGAKFGSINDSLVIAWGRQDRICFPHQAQRALELFPDAKIRWLDQCGHYPAWDAPAETVQLIIENTGERIKSRHRRHPKYGDLKIAEHVQSRPLDSPAL